MGASFSWFAVAATSRQFALNSLDLVDTRTAVKPGEAAIAGATLPGGRFVVVFDSFWHALVQPAALRMLSMDGPVVVCSEYENVNTSLAYAMESGKVLWQVSHRLDEGPDHLETIGRPPDGLAALLSHAKQARRRHEHDAVFSVPAELARLVCGFSLDQLEGPALERLLVGPTIDKNAFRARFFATATALLEAEALGRVAGTDDRFVGDDGEVKIKVAIHFDGGPANQCRPWIRVEVDHRRVRELAALFAERSPDHSFAGTLDDICKLPSTIESESELAMYLALLREAIPSVVARLRDLRALDRITNDGRPRIVMNRPTLSHWDLAIGHSRIVIAWLAGNPAFERMVAETDAARTGGADPESPVRRLAGHLRAHVERPAID